MCLAINTNTLFSTEKNLKDTERKTNKIRNNQIFKKKNKKQEPLKALERRGNTHTIIIIIIIHNLNIIGIENETDGCGEG